MFFGSGQLSTLSTFSFSISIPLGPIIAPRNLTFLTFYTHFSSLMFKSFSSSLFNTSSTILLCPSSISVPTNTSSMKTATFPSLIISLRILFIIAWNIAGEFVIPKNITIGSKDPTCIVNTLFYSSPSFILTLLKPHHKSILVNPLLLPMLSIKSVINSSRQLFFTV